MKKLLFLVLCMSVLFSCKNNDEEQRKEDEMLIQDYLAENNIDAEMIGSSGVYFRITEGGVEEEKPIASSIVRMFYRGQLLDGTVFDERVEGEDDYLESALGNLIFGWQLGVQEFTKGSKGQLFVPSHAGYGNSELPNIPKNSVLIFDIHLVNFF